MQLSPEEFARYSRHLSLPEIGIKGQKKLKGSSVLCIGCGGLGSPVLIYLAAAGIGNLGIVDNDLVEESNLQRQIIHTHKSIGKSKIESARSRIIDINPYCKVTIFSELLNNENALEIIKPYDLVCDCTDNFESRYLINDACVLLGKPYIYGAISKFEGQASVFNLDKDSPNFRDLIPQPPSMDLLPSCSESGVIGVLPGIIGLIQATEIIKIIAGIGTTLSGRILIFNALEMKFKELKLKKDYAAKPITELIDYKDFCGSSGVTKVEDSIKSISAKKLRVLLEDNPNKNILLDVRTEEEFKLNAIKGSILVPLKNIQNGQEIDKIRKLASNKNIFVHCKTGKRSRKAILSLRSNGIDAVNLEGGINSWNES